MPRKPDFLTNPLLAKVRRYSCTLCGRFDEDGGPGKSDAFRCCKCLASDAAAIAPRFAFASLLYGCAPPYVLGALALGYSIQASGTSHDRVLLHTADVPVQARCVLEVFWQLVEVPYLLSAPDLHSAPYENAKFKQIFTKLHIFNPAFLPYDRVVFLDLDTLVLKNVDALFDMRSPAAMRNLKTTGGREPSSLKHGERMEARTSYFNAGTVVVTPSRPLFDLLAADVAEPDPQWHTGAWAPEQVYLSRVLAGEWTNLSQLFNFEVQLHSGVPLSSTWETARAEDIFIAHFSGAQKVWDRDPAQKAPALGSHWVRQAFSELPGDVQAHAGMRSSVLHSEWHRSVAAALRQCRDRGLAQSLTGGVWLAALLTGEPAEGSHDEVGQSAARKVANGVVGCVLGRALCKFLIVWLPARTSLLACSPGVRRPALLRLLLPWLLLLGFLRLLLPRSCRSLRLGLLLPRPCCRSRLPPRISVLLRPLLELCQRSSPLVGDDVVVDCGDGERLLAKVVRVKAGAGTAAVWLTPSPPQEPLCAGPFGICRTVQLDTISSFDAAEEKCRFGLGVHAAVWLGEGHAWGLVVGVRPNARLIRFTLHRAAAWLPEGELRAAGAGAD